MVAKNSRTLKKKLSAGELRSAFLQAFEDLNPDNGREHLVAWGRRNPTHFYQMMTKLLPREVKASFEHKGAGDLSRDELLGMLNESSAIAE